MPLDEPQDTTVHWNDFDTPLPTECPTPLYWRVLVMPMKPRNKIKMASGVEFDLPDQSLDNQKFFNPIGRLAAVGEGAFKSSRLAVDGPPMTVPKVGDWVMFGRAAGFKFAYAGVELVEINDDEILAILPDPSKVKLHV